eukprot:3708851-Rhodomonas_salina.1
MRLAPRDSKRSKRCKVLVCCPGADRSWKSHFAPIFFAAHCGLLCLTHNLAPNSSVQPRRLHSPGGDGRSSAGQQRGPRREIPWKTRLSGKVRLKQARRGKTGGGGMSVRRKGEAETVYPGTERYLEGNVQKRRKTKRLATAAS